MSPESFCYWLSGYFEISKHINTPHNLNEEQVEEIKNHLKLVMTKVAPETSPKKSEQLPLFPSYQPIMPPFNPGVERDSTAIKPSWIDHPTMVTCGTTTFYHTGD